MSENITLRPSVHSRCTKDMDLAGKNVLLSTNFYYFGNQVQKLPKEFDNIVNIDIDFIELDENLKELFFNWLENQNFQKNKIYSTPHVIRIISPSNRELKMSCCIRKKVEESYC